VRRKNESEAAAANTGEDKKAKSTGFHLFSLEKVIEPRLPHAIYIFIIRTLILAKWEEKEES
jgi:hypothetical protein